MPTPASDPVADAPSPHWVPTCPDESQNSQRPGWDLQDEQIASEHRAPEAEERSESPATADESEMRDQPNMHVDSVIPMEEGISVEASSRATTMSPRPQSAVTMETSPTSSVSEGDMTKTMSLDEDELSRSTELQRHPTRESSSKQGRVRDSKSSSLAPESLIDNDEDDQCFSPSMGPDFPSMRTKPLLSSSFLRPGSRFHGTQQSERQVYDVQVEIKHVDLRESFLCGYLRIQGLTEDHPTLTTYFEGEIIGNKYSFYTEHDDWGASHKVDLSHWSKFSAFRPFQKPARRGPVSIADLSQREHIFMRWKEHFLVPDHRVRTINGASFEGFYYICFNQVKGEVSGIYFHSKSEKFQQLELKHVPDYGCFGAVEFR